MGEWASGVPFGRSEAGWQTDRQTAEGRFMQPLGTRRARGRGRAPHRARASDSGVVRMRGRGKAECAIGHGLYVAIQFGMRTVDYADQVVLLGEPTSSSKRLPHVMLLPKII